MKTKLLLSGLMVMVIASCQTPSKSTPPLNSAPKKLIVTSDAKHLPSIDRSKVVPFSHPELDYIKNEALRKKVWGNHQFPGEARRQGAKRRVAQSVGVGGASTHRVVRIPEWIPAPNEAPFVYAYADHSVPWNSFQSAVTVEIPTTPTYLDKDITLYAPTLLASNNSLLEVASVYTRPRPSSPNDQPAQVNFVGVWNHDIEPQAGGNWLTALEINSTFMNWYTTTYFGQSDPIYKTAIYGYNNDYNAPSNAPPNIWEAYIYNFVTYNWELIGTKIVPENETDGGRWTPKAEGWSAYEGFFGLNHFLHKWDSCHHDAFARDGRLPGNGEAA